MLCVTVWPRLQHGVWLQLYFRHVVQRKCYTDNEKICIDAWLACSKVTRLVNEIGDDDVWAEHLTPHIGSRLSFPKEDSPQVVSLLELITPRLLKMFSVQSNMVHLPRIFNEKFLVFSTHPNTKETGLFLVRSQYQNLCTYVIYRGKSISKRQKKVWQIHDIKH